MTGLMHEKEFSRKAFVKGGGALIVGVIARSAAGQGFGGQRPHAVRQRGPGDYLPDLTQVDSWITITPTTPSSSPTARPSSVTAPRPAS